MENKWPQAETPGLTPFTWGSNLGLYGGQQGLLPSESSH